MITHHFPWSEMVETYSLVGANVDANSRRRLGDASLSTSRARRSRAGLPAAAWDSDRGGSLSFSGLSTGLCGGLPWGALSRRIRGTSSNASSMPQASICRQFTRFHVGTDEISRATNFGLRNKR